MKVIKIVRLPHVCGENPPHRIPYEYHYEITPLSTGGVIKQIRSRNEAHYDRAMLLLSKRLTQREYNYMLEIFERLAFDRVNEACLDRGD